MLFAFARLRVGWCALGSWRWWRHVVLTGALVFGMIALTPTFEIVMRQSVKQTTHITLADSLGKAYEVGRFGLAVKTEKQQRSGIS